MERTPQTRLEDIRQRFIEVGIEALSTEETLELLFSYVFPRTDNRALSETVLNKYGSLRHLLSSSVRQLRTVGGLNESAAVFLALVGQTGRQMFLEYMERCPEMFAEVGDIGRYFMELVRGQPWEAFYILCLGGNTFLSCCALDGAEPVRRTLEAALESAADNVAVCRRQTGGVISLSGHDRALSEKLRAALDTVRVTFRDYMVVSDDDFVSLSETVSGTSSRKNGVIIEYAPF
ncbi:MAG: hypothetical protein IJR72_00570 [Oscillospiraceae bacterium]|nr:hypothetical protein [Oscillospiraceae bacterium]